MKTLIVKCPHCSSYYDLGKEALVNYDTPGTAFDFCVECRNCGDVFTADDTNEADYTQEG